MEEKENYNSDKSKLIAEDKWSEEIPAVIEGKTTLVSGLNGIFQSLFNRIKKVRTTFLGRNIKTGNGLSGGGNLSEDRELSVEAKDNSIIIEPEGISVNKTDLLNVSNSEVLASSKAVKELNDKLGTHKAKKSNPHEVTKAQVGLGNIMNYPFSDKYKILDGDGNKYSLQKSLKMMFDELKAEAEE